MATFTLTLCYNFTNICNTFVRSGVHNVSYIAQSKVQYVALYDDILHNNVPFLYIMCDKININSENIKNM